MMEDLQNSDTGITDMNPGSISRTLIEVIARQFDMSEYRAEQIIKLFFAKTTLGKYLDLRVEETSMEPRNKGTKASGIITASRSTPAPFGQLIPAGTIFVTEDRNIQVETDVDSTLDQGETSVHIQAKVLKIGSAGNLAAGIVLKQSGVAVSLLEMITVAAPGFKGGTDTENDTSLLARYLDYIRNPGTSGNNAHYRQWSLEVSGVGGVKVVPRWDGVGTVKVIVIDLNKEPASSQIVEAVQNYIDPNCNGDGEGKAPTGATVTVTAATSLIINVSANVNIDPAHTIEQIEAAFIVALGSYLKEIAFKVDNNKQPLPVSYAQIGSRLIDTPGVMDYNSLLVNEGTTNISLSASEVGVIGAVTLNG